MNVIEITGLVKNYPGFSLGPVDFSLPAGCITGLIGENGAGKTTIIKLLLNMIKKDSGSIKIFGQDNGDFRLKEDIGVVLGEDGIPSYIKPPQLEKIMKNTFKSWDSSAYQRYIQRFGLPVDKAFGDYSKGMKMKLNITVALSHNPKLLLMDEATAGLDPVVRDEILDIFSDFTRDENHSILISSHIVSDLEKICDYVSFIHKGKIILSEEKDRLREEYVMVRGRTEQISAIPVEKVIGTKYGPYGAEAIVKRNAVPSGMSVSPVDIESLFIFMVKER